MEVARHEQARILVMYLAASAAHATLALIGLEPLERERGAALRAIPNRLHPAVHPIRATRGEHRRQSLLGAIPMRIENWRGTVHNRNLFAFIHKVNRILALNGRAAIGRRRSAETPKRLCI